MAARAEKDIRNAIGELIESAFTVEPLPVVLPRNLLGRIREGTYTELLDSDSKVHGWMITEYSAVPTTEKFKQHVEYGYRYLVWQFYEHDLGTDAANTEDQASVERDTVTRLFLPSATSLCGGVRGCGPLEFSQAFYPGTLPIDLIGVGDKMLHIAQGTLLVKETLP